MLNTFTFCLHVFDDSYVAIFCSEETSSSIDERKSPRFLPLAWWSWTKAPMRWRQIHDKLVTIFTKIGRGEVKR